MCSCSRSSLAVAAHCSLPIPAFPRPSSTLAVLCTGTSWPSIPALHVPSPAHPSAVGSPIPPELGIPLGPCSGTVLQCPGLAHLPSTPQHSVPGAWFGTGLLLIRAQARGEEAELLSVWAGESPDPAANQGCIGKAKGSTLRHWPAGGGLLYWPLSPWLQVTHTGQLMEKKPYIQSVHINISNVHFIHK